MCVFKVIIYMIKDYQKDWKCTCDNDKVEKVCTCGTKEIEICQVCAVVCEYFEKDCKRCGGKFRQGQQCEVCSFKIENLCGNCFDSLENCEICRYPNIENFLACKRCHNPSLKLFL